MTYKVNIEHTDEGVAVWCPGLPKCWSEGTDEAEALANIRDAIAEYLTAVEQLTETAESRYVEVG